MDRERPIRLVVVAPGPKARGRLRDALEAVPGVDVVAEAADVRGAALVSARVGPDAVLLAAPTTEKDARWVFPALLRMAPAVPVLLTPLEMWFPDGEVGAPDVRRFAEVLRLAWSGEDPETQKEGLAVLAHDIVTPAASVTAVAEMLLRYWDRFDERERRRALEGIAGLGRELARLVERLVRSGADGRGGLVGERRLLEIGPILEQAVGQASSSGTGHRFELSVAPGLPKLRIDPGAVVEAVANYLSNAVKYAPPGSAIRVAAGSVDGEVRITVADEGPGIHLNDQDHLFQKFSRLSGNGAGGHGLGLYIARTIAEAHGGRVWVESRPGQGAMFGLAIPAPATGIRTRRRRTRLGVPR
ncbi:MAG TPA: ATP-binding protein [Actinomycetota bacterium]|jgi:signal transduction histidine kinase|nr:ATP-binding protein [Actinomycetota bacterium]